MNKDVAVAKVQEVVERMVDSYESEILKLTEDVEKLKDLENQAQKLIETSAIAINSLNAAISTREGSVKRLEQECARIKSESATEREIAKEEKESFIQKQLLFKRDSLAEIDGLKKEIVNLKSRISDKEYKEAHQKELFKELAEALNEREYDRIKYAALINQAQEASK